MRSTRFLYPTLMFFIGLSFHSCALLGVDPNSSGSDEEEDLKNDPIARAALPFRNSRSSNRGLAASSSPPPSSAETPSDGQGVAPGPQLVVGMTMPGVRNLWGQPVDVETAGDRQAGNERWVYQNGLASAHGTSAYRAVYFEGGRVVGWESGHSR